MTLKAALRTGALLRSMAIMMPGHQATKASIANLTAMVGSSTGSLRRPATVLATVSPTQHPATVRAIVPATASLRDTMMTTVALNRATLVLLNRATLVLLNRATLVLLNRATLVQLHHMVAVATVIAVSTSSR